MKYLWYSLKKSKFSFYFIVYAPMLTSDVINYVAKLNMNVMASMFSPFKTCEVLERQKPKKKKKKKKKKKISKSNLSSYQNVPYIRFDSFVQKQRS